MNTCTCNLFNDTVQGKASLRKSKDLKVFLNGGIWYGFLTEQTKLIS